MIYRTLTFGNVQIEEVTVENGLDCTGKDHNQVVVALRKVSVDPVQQVERPIAAQSEQIMARNALGLARLRD